MKEAEFLLRAYGDAYGPQAGPWNCSRDSLYLEYSMRRFFEQHFSLQPGMHICNIGIGAGEWDRYLTYLPCRPEVTSIDRDPLICRCLEERFSNEKNPNPAKVLCRDASSLPELEGRCSLVTLVGSTLMESGGYTPLLESALRLLKAGGALYYMTLDPLETMDDLIQFGFTHPIRFDHYAEEEAGSMQVKHWKVTKTK